MIIDMDMECRKKQEEKLRATIPPTQTIHFVTGSSCEPATIETVRAILGARQLDAGLHRRQSLAKLCAGRFQQLLPVPEEGRFRNLPRRVLGGRPQHIWVSACL